MRKFKRIVAITLAATMVAGGSLMSFAAGETSGEAQGTGSSEGHVDKKVTKVVLPTVAPGSASSFDYTMDPERLVSGTAHEKYENAEFPAKDTDTGVYFNNGKKGGDGADKDNTVFANTSLAQKVINKSSHSIDLTVKAEAVTAETDIPLVEKDALTTADTASLYLGLIVDTEAAVAVTKDTVATKTVSIAGTEENFKIAAKADKSGYEYRELTLDEYKALDGNSSAQQADYDATWKVAEFKLEGSTTDSKAIETTTTAPVVKVTWSWVDPSAEPSLSQTSYTKDASNSSIEVTVNNLGDDTIKAVINNGNALGAAMVTISGNKVTLTSALLRYVTSESSFKIVTTEGKELTFTVSP